MEHDDLQIMRLILDIAQNHGVKIVCMEDVYDADCEYMTLDEFRDAFQNGEVFEDFNLYFSTVESKKDMSYENWLYIVLGNGDYTTVADHSSKPTELIAKIVKEIENKYWN